MEDYFSFLPEIEDGIMFVDNCSLEFVRKIEGGRIKDSSFKERLEGGHERLSLLAKKLKSMENWVTIKEVAEEVKEGIDGLKEIKKKRSARKIIQLIERGIYVRKRVYRLLNKKERNAANNLPENSVERINDFLLPKAEEIFQRVGGKLNNRNTDCKLAVHSLAFAEDIPVYMFSYDKPLLATYSILAKRLGQTIQGTYVIDELSKKWGKKKTLSTLTYYDWRKLGRFDW